MKVLLATVAVGLFVPIAAGCGPVARGTLVGTVRIYGGPAQSNGRMALEAKPVPGRNVSARSGSTVVTVVTDSSGRFTFHLLPGRYTLSCAGLLEGRSQPVEVRSKTQASADCRVDVP